MDVQDAPWIMPIKLNDTQYNTELEEKYKNVGLLDFYSKYIEKEKFPAILSHALFMMSLLAAPMSASSFSSRSRTLNQK
jgi:hypothetical protein